MAEKTSLAVGQEAPDFCLPNQDNQEVCLRDFRGRWVVLYFYPKDDTSGCTMEAIDFTNHIPLFKNLNAEIVGVSPDSPESHQKFIKKHNLQVTLLSDPDHQVLSAYDVWKKKSLYGREYMGVVRTTFLIDPEGKIAAIWPAVKVKGHAEEVRQKLEELQSK